MQSITLQTSDSAITSSDILGRLNFAASAESDGGAAILQVGSIYAMAEGTFSASANPASIIFATSASDTSPAQDRLKISYEGHFFPMTNDAYDLGSNSLRFRSAHTNALTINNAYSFPTSDGSTDQVLKTDGAGNLSFTTISAGSSYTAGSGLTLVGTQFNVYGGSANFKYAELTSSNSVPTFKYLGSGVTDTPINMEVRSSFQSATGSGTALLFQGTQGQLFSITDNLSSGTIFNVSDITGLPMLEITASGDVEIGEFADNITIHQPVLISGGVPSGTTNKLYNDNGSLYFNGSALGGGLSNIVEDTTPQLGGTLDANGNSIDMGTNTITDTKVGQWDTAYGWGDHSTQGYLTTDSDTTYTAGSGLTLVGTEFNTAGTGNFEQIEFGPTLSSRVRIGVATDISVGVAIGDQAGSGSTTCHYANMIGFYAGKNANLALDTTCIGSYAGRDSYDSRYSVFIGRLTGDDSIKLQYTNAIGFEAAGYVASGQMNNYYGAECGRSAIGNYNNGFGFNALRSITGNSNIELVTNGSSTSIIGTNDNKIHIENTIIGDTSSKLLAIGNVSSGNLTPDATLEILPKVATDTGLIVQGATSQSATLQEWQNSSETKLLAVGPDGGLEIPSNSPSTTTNKLYNDGSNLNFGTKVIIDSNNVNTGLQYQPLGGGLNVTGLTTTEFAAATLVTESDAISSNDNDTTIPTSAAVKDYVDGQGYATLASPTFTGTPLAPTATSGTNTTQIATTAFVVTAIDNLVGGAPGALDTLNELAAAINDDSSYASTITTALATKLENIVEDTTPQLGGTLDANGNTIDMGTYVITDAKVGQWDTAYGWGDHSSAGYLTSQTSHADVVVDGDFGSQGIMLRGASAGSYSILTDNSSNWNTAYGWGDHASAGYSTTDTTYTAGSGLTLVGTEFNVYGGSGHFNQILFQDNKTQIGYNSYTEGSGISIGTDAGRGSSNSTYSNGFNEGAIFIGNEAGLNADPYDLFGDGTFFRGSTILIGHKSGSNSQTYNSIGIGHLALQGSIAHTTIAIGDRRGMNASGLYASVLIDSDSGDLQQYCTSIKASAMKSSTYCHSIGGGYQEGNEYTVSIGEYAASQMKNVSHFVGIGRQAGAFSSGDFNTFIGARFAGYQTTGNYNIGMGYYPLFQANGSNNIDIQTAGSTNVIGTNSNKLHIENTIIGDTSSKLLAIGNVTSSDLTPDATLEIKPNATTDIGLIVQAVASHSASLQEWQNSSETKLLAVGPDGGLEIPSNTPSTTTNKLYNDGSNLNFGTKVIIDSTNVNTGLQYQPLGGGLNVTGLTTTEFSAATLVTEADSISSNDNDTTIPTSAAVKAYADSVAVSPGGSDTQIQFNDGGSFGGDADLVWNKTTNALTITGSLNATTKSFLIDHPSKPGMKLQYASLEGPENGVYVRGTTDSGTITLPDYWRDLVHNGSITVTLTPVGQFQPLFVEQKSNREIRVGGVCGYYDYVVYGERKDVDKLEVEW